MLKSSPPKEMPRLKPSRISVMRWSKNPMVEFSSESMGDDNERLKSGFIPKGSTDLGGELPANGSAPKTSLPLDGVIVRGWIGGGHSFGVTGGPLRALLKMTELSSLRGSKSSSLSTTNSLKPSMAIGEVDLTTL